MTVLPPLKQDEVMRCLTGYSKCRLSRVFTMRILGLDDPRDLQMLMSEANLPLPSATTLICARRAEDWLPEPADDGVL